MTTKAEDTEYQDIRIISLEPQKSGGWMITREDSWSFFVPDKGIEPHVGDTARFYSRGIGTTVRGLDINGQTVFYRTAEEDRAEGLRQVEETNQKRREEYEENAAEYEQKILALPPPFQRRIARFRRTNPDFNWRFLSYELFCCAEAVKIATHCKTVDSIYEFSKLSWKEQQQRIPELDDGHSGNTFGMACRLAQHYVNEPHYVVLEHGGISNLVGCDEFGCLPGAGLEDEDAQFYLKLIQTASEKDEQGETI